MKNKIQNLVSDFKAYWNNPMPGRYIPFKGIAAYSGGGIGAYMVITMGTACLLSANSVLLGSTLGIAPTDMYIMYVLAVLANIPMTGIRANIIDNTRNKAGKYRPYIVTMALPAAIICNLLVWFPYGKLEAWLGTGEIFGETRAYVAKCAIVMVLNLALHFFYYFFYDAYENLIHVLSPNSQERADVASIKSVVYSLAPSIVNLITPIIAKNIFKSNMTDIRVYRLLYPILTILGILLCIVVYKYTEEKIVQAKTHVVRIRFTDALKAVAKNKYFWIISLAGWIGFLEAAYSNIMFWLYNYGGACNGDQYGLIVTLYGNASLWGMLLAPFCIKRWGKKAVLIVTNLFNIVFILMMLPFVSEITNATIWLVMACLWFNALMGSFAHILNPAIQADIRDYQQYKTGERIDGMFAAVATIGTVINLVSSFAIPAIYEKGGITEENAKLVTSRPEILNKVLDGGKTIGQMLEEQLAIGQDNYSNPNSALYDPDILLPLLRVLIIVAAFGALMNVIPYIWYDFNEKKQKSVVRVLKIRAMFEDYGNGVLNDGTLVEAVDIIRTSRDMVNKSPKDVSKKTYKSISDKQKRKEAKKLYRADLEYNEEIEIAQFVCEELEKFTDDATVMAQYTANQKVYKKGLKGLYSADINELKADLNRAKALPKSTKEEKELRKASIEIARNMLSSKKAIKKYYSDINSFTEPDYKKLESYFNLEDECDAKIKSLYLQLSEAKKQKDGVKAKELKAAIKATQAEKANAKKQSKSEIDRQTEFARAAKPYIDAEKMIKERENYTHLEELAAQYDEAKARYEAAEAARIEEQKREEAAKKADKERRLAAKAGKK